MQTYEVEHTGHMCAKWIGPDCTCACYNNSYHIFWNDLTNNHQPHVINGLRWAGRVLINFEKRSSTAFLSVPQ